MGDKNPHNANKTQVVEQQRYLPNDLIIEEILQRLPVKSVVRFKSVSKQWYSTLSSSDFANAHLMRSPFSHPSAPVNTLFIKSDNNFYLFSYNDDDHFSGNFEDNLVKLNPDFSKEEHEIRIAGSCNGLICLTPDSFEYFIIWNPATRKLHKYELHGYFKCFEKGHAVLGAPGFGYASSVDDYKYVEILLVHHGHVVSDCIVCIFSMRENRWRKIDYGKEPLYLGSRAMLVNEKLYWSAQSEISGARNLLLSFDLGVERFDVIEIDGDGSGLLGVMRGCLSKCNYRETFIGDNSDKFLHIMEPPTIVKSIGLPKGLKLDPSSEMIGLTKTGKYFVTGPFSDDERDFLNRTLGIVDTCTTPMQYTTLLRFNDELEFEIARYVPSLVSPFPIEDPSEG